jgi:hypothetical protein
VAPCAPAGGDTLPIAGLLTVNITLELLVMEFTMTVTGPVVTLLGAVATIVVSVQEITAAGTPLKLAVLVPWLYPNFEPLIAT